MVSTLVTQSRIASLTASLSVAVPDVTERTSVAERVHAQDVGALALDVLGAHVDDARQVEQGTGGRGRDAVLAGTGLRDHPGLAEAPGQQGLAERVVDLVGTRVREVLALEVEPEIGDPGVGGSPAGGRRFRQPGRLRPHGRGQAVRAVDGGRPAGEAFEELAQLRPEDRVVAEGVVGGLSCSRAAISVSGT